MDLQSSGGDIDPLTLDNTAQHKLDLMLIEAGLRCGLFSFTGDSDKRPVMSPVNRDKKRRRRKQQRQARRKNRKRRRR